MSKDSDCRREYITREKVSEIYLQSPVSNSTIFLVIALYGYILYGHVETYLLSLWAGALAITALYRLFLWYRHKQTQDYEPEEWLTRYTHASSLVGIAWSLVYLLVEIPNDVTLVGLVLLLFFGVTVSAYSILSIHLQAYFLYTVPSYCAVNFMLLGYTGDTYIAVTLSITIFFVMMGLFAVNVNRHLLETISLKYKNQTLVEELHLEVNYRDEKIAEGTRLIREVNRELSRSKDQLINVINGSNLGYWDWYYQTGFHEVNDRWLEILGLERVDINNDVSDWEKRIHPDDKERMQDIVASHIKDRTYYVADFRMRHKDGHWVWIQGSGSVVEYDNETGEAIRLCGTHRDISKSKKLEKELEHRATHDLLTGLLNRNELQKRLRSEIERADRYTHSLSLLMVDVDHFKSINDSYGHSAGDSVLKQFSQQLLDHMRSIDIVARYGGEEFVIVLPETSFNEASDLAERLRIKISEMEVPINSDSLAMTASIGIATYPVHCRTASELIELADKAMYLAKKSGRNRTKAASPEFQQGLRE